MSTLNTGVDPARGAFAVTLERGLAVLAVFGREARPLGVTEAARILEMKPSTLHRYVRTLANLGYLRQDPATLKYGLDVKVADLGLAAINSLDVTEVARPHLRELRDAWGVTVNMAVLDGGEIVYLERLIGAHSMDLHLQVGSRQPAYCTSMGKALLAHLEPQELDRVLQAAELVRRGPRTITDPDELRAELEKVRRQGYALNNEELTRGLRSIAAPIRDGTRSVVAAINLHASPYAVAEIRSKLAPAVRATAADISRRLGATLPTTPSAA